MLVLAEHRHYEQICEMEAVSYPADEAATPERIAMRSLPCCVLVAAPRWPAVSALTRAACKCSMKNAGPFFMVREEEGQVVGFVNGEAETPSLEKHATTLSQRER
jgi:hypothetical protein